MYLSEQASFLCILKIKLGQNLKGIKEYAIKYFPPTPVSQPFEFPFPEVTVVPSKYCVYICVYAFCTIQLCNGIVCTLYYNSCVPIAMLLETTPFWGVEVIVFQ